jgi:hypothetical protein
MPDNKITGEDDIIIRAFRRALLRAALIVALPLFIVAACACFATWMDYKFATAPVVMVPAAPEADRG